MGPLYTWDWVPVTITLQALSLVEKAELVQVRFTLRLRDQRSMWMQDGCKIYMDTYMASSGSCFMVTWTMFKNHLLEVGLTQNQGIMAFQMLTTIDVFYFIMCEHPHEWKFIEKHLLEGPITYDFTLHLWIRDHTTWFWRCVGDGLWTLSFGLSQLHGHHLMSMRIFTLIINKKFTWIPKIMMKAASTSIRSR